MDLLKKIVKAKKAGILKDKEKTPVISLENSKYFESPVRSLAEALRNKNGYGIIAEFKRRSPSKGIINAGAMPGEVCPAYLNSGAAAVSVLTNEEFFGGSNLDFFQARESCSGPLLRKEFIIDEYQVIESKSLGADAILLIADILTEKELKGLSDLALSLNMEVLFEIHDESGINKLPGNCKLVGVNSRNLGTFSINMDVPSKIIGKLPESSIKIAESGIHSAEKLVEFNQQGFGGFLIGEMFMKEQCPGTACKELIRNIENLQAIQT